MGTPLPTYDRAGTKTRGKGMTHIVRWTVDLAPADDPDLERAKPGLQGAAQLSDEGAATLAAMMTSIRGPGAPGTTPAECRDVTPSFLADFNAVRARPHLQQLRMRDA